MRKMSLFLFFLVLFGCTFWYLRKEKVAEAPGVSGEINSAKTPQTNSQPSEADRDIASKFEELLAAKYRKNIESVKVKIAKHQGDFIVGGVAFDGGSEGGYLLGAKLLGSWRIVFDGNGSISCNLVDSIQFPASLQTECWDTTTNQLIDRTKRPGMTLQ